MMPFFNMMQQGQGMNPFSSPMGGGMPQPMSAAPQIPVRQPPAGSVSPQTMPAPPQQQPQQQGFFGNMMSSPTQMANGIKLGQGAYDGISGMFSGPKPGIAADGLPMGGGTSGGINYGPFMGAAPDGMSAAGGAAANGINWGPFMGGAASAAPTAAVAAAPALASAVAPAASAATAAGGGGLFGWLMGLL